MEDEYPKSGTVVARKLVAALVPYFPESSVARPGANEEYLLKPQILHWEDRATEWSGKPDRVKFLCRFTSLGGLSDRRSFLPRVVGGHPEATARKICLIYRFKFTRLHWLASRIRIVW